MTLVTVKGGTRQGNFLSGDLLNCDRTVRLRTTKFSRAAQVGERISMGRPRPQQKVRGTSVPKILGPYLRPYCLT